MSVNKNTNLNINRGVNIKLFGCEYRIATLELTTDDLEAATPSQLSKWLSYAEFELDIVETKRLYDIADLLVQAIKIIRAQQSMNMAASSRSNGVICGVI